MSDLLQSVKVQDVLKGPLGIIPLPYGSHTSDPRSYRYPIGDAEKRHSRSSCSLISQGRVCSYHSGEV